MVISTKGFEEVKRSMIISIGSYQISLKHELGFVKLDSSFLQKYVFFFKK